MADWTDFLEDGMIVDCTTISIQYTANGLANVSLTVYTPSDSTPYDPDGPGFELCIGETTFTGWVTEMSLSPTDEVELSEWRVSAIAIGCKKGPCNAGC